MNEPASPIGRFDFRRGALRGTHLDLHPGCLVHRGANHVDIIALRSVAAVRIGYERDERLLGWGTALLLVALLVLAASGPLGALAGGAAADMAAKLRAEPTGTAHSVLGVLHGTFLFLQAFAEALPIAAGALGVWGLALLGFGALGRTTLALTLSGAERVYTARGRDSRLFDFAEQVGAVLRLTAR